MILVHMKEDYDMGKYADSTKRMMRHVHNYERLQNARRLCKSLRIDWRAVYPRTILSDIVIYRLFWNRE